MSNVLRMFKCPKCGNKIRATADVYKCCGSVCKEICPLPPIRSKEWEWHRASDCIISSNFCDYVVFHDGDTRASVDVWGIDGIPVLEGIRSVALAKRIAELMARSDWRKENKKK